jgi:DNA-directed RNA polymerase subunit RPC12/RpoP
MKKELVERYKCEWCGAFFDKPDEALDHEKKSHKCPKCKHGWLLYGSELTCDTSICDFELKK